MKNYTDDKFVQFRKAKIQAESLQNKVPSILQYCVLRY